MKRHKPSQWNSWGLWERWILATSIAEVIGLAIVAVVSLVVTHFGYIQGTFILVGTLEGIVLGFAQWLVLRRYIKHSTRWIIATVIGALFAWFTGLTISALMAIAYAGVSDITKNQAFIKGLFLLGAGLGTMLGFCQWLVIKNQIRFSILWIVANAIAWAVGLFIAYVGVGMVQENFSLQTALVTAVTGTAMGAVIGGITGTALVCLLKSSQKQIH
ncbi:hypothetical protein [Calothrix sp. UHCC 0171]|uniref:hypothetical protein n=1 Tax=Calothrix sp. UHCC 0171 TaxID=3110245 RepID=UPI002B20BB14|nr:hypothetical protein [Calothrix sp. UHCC 0171]MEA5572701.1 hypothetical protein [Calothrix sp. UHCC 0171]